MGRYVRHYAAEVAFLASEASDHSHRAAIVSGFAWVVFLGWFLGCILLGWF